MCVCVCVRACACVCMYKLFVYAYTCSTVWVLALSSLPAFCSFFTLAKWQIPFLTESYLGKRTNEDYSLQHFDEKSVEIDLQAQMVRYGPNWYYMCCKILLHFTEPCGNWYYLPSWLVLEDKKYTVWVRWQFSPASAKTQLPQGWQQGARAVRRSKGRNMLW